MYCVYCCEINRYYLFNFTALLELETQAFCYTRSNICKNTCMWQIKCDLICDFSVLSIELHNKCSHCMSRSLSGGDQGAACCEYILLFNDEETRNKLYKTTKGTWRYLYINKCRHRQLTIYNNPQITQRIWLPIYGSQSETTINSCLWLRTNLGNHRHTKHLDSTKTHTSPWPNQNNKENKEY